VSKTGSGLGTVTGGFINCGQFCVQTNIAEGTILTLTATPTQGSSFGGWSGLCTGTDLTCTLVVRSSGTITANFNVDSTPTYTLYASKVGEGKIVSSQGIDCGTDCSETYAQNSVVSITAIPSEGHVFTVWSGDCSGTSNVCTITINSNKNVVANFSLSQIGKMYHVKKDGTGNFITIQECANVANAGDTCLVYAGDYPEFVQTTKDGNSEESRITFKANGNVKVKGFRVKNKYITIDGFDISKYAIGLSPAHITIEPEGHYCIIKNNVIHDGIQLLSDNYYFNGTTKTITNPNGGFLRAGFEPGTKIYVASNINNWILNHDITRTIKSVTDTTITINDDETLYTEGPVLALIYATRVAKSGVDGITMIYSSRRGTPNNCVISQNTISNLAGSALTIAGSNHLIEKNTIEKMNGWFIITFYGSNNIFKYNHVKNAHRYYGFERPDKTAVHSEGQGSWDFVAPIIRSFGNTVVESINNVFEYNFFENLDNEFANVNSTSITYDNPKPTGKTIFRNNVFANIEMHGAFHRPETIFENNTFYKAAYDTSNPVFTISTTKDGNAEGSIVKNNVFVETNHNYTNSSTGSYNIMNVNNYYANYNFVAGAVAENFPPINGFKGKETNGINGGNPKFQNINNLLGNDNVPFTQDDGLIPLEDSFLCSNGENGTYIGAYSCKNTQKNNIILKITNPIQNANVNNIININVETTSNNPISEIRFFIDANLLGIDNTAPYSTTLNTHYYRNGAHEIKAIAKDNAGNTQTTTIIVKINNADNDNDGVSNIIDKCPNTRTGIKVNNYGCPFPIVDKFDIKPDFNNIDITTMNELEIGITNKGKIKWETTLKLTATINNTEEPLDLNNDLNISNNKISLNQNKLRELNKPATITLYTTTQNPKIMKDNKECTQCRIIEKTSTYVKFTVPNFEE
ncbi:MAG: Ig-like domain-containing protein, partial [Candidatus Diapherotrites archaeon]